MNGIGPFIPEIPLNREDCNVHPPIANTFLYGEQANIEIYVFS